MRRTASAGTSLRTYRPRRRPSPHTTGDSLRGGVRGGAARQLWSSASVPVPHCRHPLVPERDRVRLQVDLILVLVAAPDRGVRSLRPAVLALHPALAVVA